MTRRRISTTAPWLRTLLVGLLALACLVLQADAQEAAPTAEDPVLEARVLAVSGELRCLVCQLSLIHI